MNRKITRYGFALSMSLLGWCSIQRLAAQAVPTDNPIASFYSTGHDYPAWVSEVRWDNVVTMTNQATGSANFDDFKVKRDQLYAQGGGVLYYPAGTYTFEIPEGPNDEGLMLKKGVVIRGEKPLTDDRAVTVKNKMALATDHGLNAMPTKFVFTTTNSPGGNAIPGNIPKAWNMIGMKKGTNEAALSDVSHVGVAWIEMEYGYIFFGMDNKKWADTWATSNSWLGTKAVNGWAARVPDGTHPMDPFHGTRNGLGNDTGFHGQKMFVFGVHMKNSAIPNYMSNKAGVAEFTCDVESWRFAGKLTIEGKHVFIANNLISKPTANFRMPYVCKGGGNIPNGTVVNGRFDYGYGVGIDVNKGLGSAFKNRAYMDNPVESIYYAEDVIIQDNVIYNHGNKSIEAAGKYLIIKGNVIPRDFLGHNDDPYGIGAPGVGINTSNGKCHTQENPDDMMSRTMDLGGWMTWVDDNYGKFTGTSYANDGEGILYQRHNGIETYGVAITNNHLQDGYLAPYDVHAVGVLHAWNFQPGSIGIIKQETNWIEDCAFPGTTNTPVKTTSATGTNVQDYLNNCDLTVSPVDSTVDLEITWDAIHSAVKVKYTDNSTNEIGFRIEKRLLSQSGPWTLVAYRPRQQTSGFTMMNTISRSFGYPTPLSLSFPETMKIDDLNPMEWYDYKGDPNGIYQYRVVAIDCNNNDVAANNPIVVTSAKAKIVDVFNIAPNPATSHIRITSKGGFPIKYAELVSLDGKTVKSKIGDINPEMNFSTEGVAAGFYILNITSSVGSRYKEKVLISW